MSDTGDLIPRPSYDEIKAAARVISDWGVHVHQLLYRDGLTGSSGQLLVKLSEPTYLFDVGHLRIIVKHTTDEVQFGFSPQWSEPDESILERARLLVSAIGRGHPFSHACCPLAVRRPCVCVASMECPLHGRMCVGSHD